MKISSNFVDYYDYLTHVYGSDPLIFYLRRNLKEFRTFNIPIKWEDTPYFPSYSFEDVRDHIKYYGLSVMGFFYLVKAEGVLNNVKMTLDLNPRVHRWSKKMAYTAGTKYAFLDKIAKDIKQPVFFFEINRGASSLNNAHVEVLDILPNLSVFDFASIIPAEKIYQDLSYYIANIINDGIDIKPPSEIANNDKILQAGFDLKKSFRHRQ